MTVWHKGKLTKWKVDVKADKTIWQNGNLVKEYQNKMIIWWNRKIDENGILNNDNLKKWKVHVMYKLNIWQFDVIYMLTRWQVDVNPDCPNDNLTVW